MINESDDNGKRVSYELYRTLRVPIIVYTVLMASYAALKKGKFEWFSWHPVCMFVAFVGMATNAMLMCDKPYSFFIRLRHIIFPNPNFSLVSFRIAIRRKKIGGYANTKLHGFLMLGAVCRFSILLLLSRFLIWPDVSSFPLFSPAMCVLAVCQVALALFGWYVIYSNKEMFGRKHLQTLHGQLGAFVVVM